MWCSFLVAVTKIFPRFFCEQLKNIEFVKNVSQEKKVVFKFSILTANASIKLTFQ